MSLDSDQFGRAYKLEIGERSYDTEAANALRLVYSVERDLTSLPNNAEIAIFNLSEDSRYELEAFQSNTVRLQVGYKSRVQEIFFGVLRDAFSSRAGPDIITTLSAGDGEKEFIGSRVKRTYSKGTPVFDILTDLVQRLGVGSGNLVALTTEAALGRLKLKDGSTKLPKAMTLNGSVATELKIWCTSLGLEYSIQSNEFIVTRLGEPSNLLGPLISPATGLIGTPCADADGIVTGTALSLPDLTPGVAFALESERISGQYRARKTKHYGDTHGQPWYVDFEGVPL